ADRLREEIEAWPDEAWRPHPTGHKGNTATLLMSTGGSSTDDTIGGVHHPTEWLIRSPYLAQTVAAFGVPIGRTRLMRIEPGGTANPHYDTHLYWKDRVRIHVPIVTNEEVTFISGGERVHMAAGESWIFDTFRIHDVLNPTDLYRIHLVLDTVGTPAFWDLVRNGGDPVDVAFEPDVSPVLVPERENLPVVMSPGQMNQIIDDLAAELPDGVDAAAIIEACRRFHGSWTTLWAASGLDPNALGYQQERDRFTAELGQLTDVRMPYNNASAVGQARVWLASGALNPQLATSAPVNVPAPAAPDAAASTTLPNLLVLEPTPPSAAVDDGRAKDPRFDRPIIVVSPPRAGSSMLFETLTRAPGLFSIGGESHGVFESIPALQPANRGWESNDLFAADATPEVKDRLRDLFFSGLRDADGNAPAEGATGLRFLEKTPKNALRIEFLDELFPDARYVYLLRNPRDQISSMIDAWRSGGFVTYPNLPDWTGKPWSLLLVPGWRDQIGKTIQEICAHQWEVTTNRIMDDLERVAPGRWIGVDYHRVVANPSAEVARICRFAEIDWDPQFDQPLPMSRHTLTPPKADKWRMNATELNEVLPRVTQTLGRVNRLSGVDETPDLSRRARSANRAAKQPAIDPSLMKSVHTNSVAALLGENNLTLLLSTYQSGQMISLRTMDGVLNTHFTPMPRPMGIAALGADRLAVGTDHEVWTYRNQPSVAAKVEPKGSHARAYVLRDRHVTGDIQIHEMHYDANGALWVVATRFSCLATLDPEHSFVPRWKPWFVSAIAAEDRCHLNGLAMRDGKPKYVTAFAESDTPQGWRETKATTGMVIDIEQNEILARGICMPHSPRWYRDQLWVLESGRGSLARVNLDTGELETVVELPGFTRGLQFAGKFAFVGLSQVRESVFHGIPLTQRDEERHSGIWVVDIETGKVVGFVRFDGVVQEVFDLQVMQDKGHVQLVDLDSEQQRLSFVVPTDVLAKAS
ncbi:MAG: hypothetical protein RLZZ01_1742, partial [Actinomycetota bacterium]